MIDKDLVKNVQATMKNDYLMNGVIDGNRLNLCKF